MSWNLIVGGAGAFFTFLAAAFWLRASLVTVPDNIDTFISVLQRIGRLNAYGAACASVAALCFLYLWWTQLKGSL